MNKNQDHEADAGGHGERGGQREENRRDNPRMQPKRDAGKVSDEHAQRGREIPDPQKSDARRRQESGRKGGSR